MEPPRSTSDPGRGALVVAALALFLAAANLRPAIAAVSPLVEQIRADQGLTASGVALLTAVPTLAMGACAPLAARVGRRYGLQTGVLVGLLVIALATAARAFGESTWLQLGSAAAVGAGIAIAQTLLPAVVKARFAARAGLATGLYTAGMGLGGAVAAGVSAPLAAALGSWPGALASWSVLAVAGAALWSAARRQLGLADDTSPVGPATRGMPWRSPVARRITGLAAVNSALYYCELAWVPPLLHDGAGRDAASAGAMLTVLISLQVVAMLTVPLLVEPWDGSWAALALTMTLTACGFLGLAFAPGTATWVWIVALGLGHGGLFTLVLTLPVVAARDAGEAGRISAMAFFVGYGCAALAPLVVGALRDATGDFVLAFGLLGGLGLLALLPIARLRRTLHSRTAERA
jgi:CP family cyanate transporter-like MFS transporter